MKLNIFLLCILLIATLFVGYLKCFLGTCFATLPMLGMLSFGIAIITSLRIYNSTKLKSVQILGFSLVAIYPIVSLTLAFLGIMLFTDLYNKQARELEQKRTTMREAGTPEIGTITKQNGKYTYVCLPCKFKVTFPDTWTYKTDQINYGDTKNPYLKLSLDTDPGSLIITSYNDDSDNIQKPAEENRNMLGGESLGYTIENKNINGSNFRISKKLGEAATKISDNYAGIYGFAQYKDRKLTIEAPVVYPSEPNAIIINNFMTLIENIEFID